MGPLPSGVPGVDEVIGGGLLRGSCVLIEGVPGAGKTTLGLQIATARAEQGDKTAVILFEELPGNVVRDAKGLGIDVERLEREGRLELVCTSPDILWEQLSSGSGPLGRELAEGELSLVFIDSISHLHEYGAAEAGSRQAIYSLMSGLKRAGVTSLLSKELSSSDPQIVAFEEYVADSVWRLSYATEPDQRRHRYLEVLKSRGAPHRPGKHALAITARGVVVYPRACGALSAPAAPAAEHIRLLSTGAHGLDEMLGGGLPEGFSVLVAGGAGVGKTTLCLGFCCTGAAQGEPALYVSLQEPASKLLRLGDGLELGLRGYVDAGLVRIEHVPPVNLSIDALLARVVGLVDETGARRLVVDSLTELEASSEGDRLREFVYCLSDHAQRRGVTLAMTSEMGDLFGPAAVTSKNISVIADGIILLKYLELESEVQRCLSVLKLRTMDHDKSIKRFVIGPKGLQVLSRFEGAQGVLAGAPSSIPITLAVRSFNEFDERFNEEILQRFAQLHSKVQPVPLTLQHNPDEALATIERALQTTPSALSAAPLCMYWMPQILDPERLMDLDELWPNREDYLADMVDAACVGESLYALPAIAVCGVLLYRRDLLEKHGFTDPPATWEELVDQAKTVMAGEGSPDLIGYSFPGYMWENLNATFLMNLWSNGGDVLDTSGRLVLDSEAARGAARFMYEAVHVHHLAPADITSAQRGLHPEQDFWDGNAVFVAERPLAAIRMFQQHSPLWDSVGIAPPPRGPRGTEGVSFLGGWHYAIPRSARSPMTAAEFIQFMTSRQIQKERALRGGPMPVLRDLYDDPEILSAIPHYRVLRDVVRKARSRHHIPRYLDVSRVMQQSLHAMLCDTRTPEAAVADMARDVAEVLAAGD